MNVNKLIKRFNNNFKDKQVIYNNKEYVVLGFAITYNDGDLDVLYRIKSIESERTFFMNENELKIRKTTNNQLVDLYSELFNIEKELKSII